MKTLRRLKRSIYKKMLNVGLISPKVVVLLDGGICSQMHQYLLGQLYKERGYEVVYDLSFYDEWGMDKDHMFVRNFDLLKAFPYLKMKVSTRMTNAVYKQKFYNVGNNTNERVEDFSFLEKKPPLYLGGYYYLPATIWLPVFRSTFRVCPEVLDENNMQVFNEISACSCSVAVHVRRGDLKVELYDYGKPASSSYFDKSILYFKQKMNSPFFYFFSDEPEWVTSELIPQLKLKSNECKVVDINGSDKGYMDLYLIAQCQHQITSKGTLGKYGALLNDNSDKIVVLCDDEIEYMWKELLCNPVFL